MPFANLRACIAAQSANAGNCCGIECSGGGFECVTGFGRDSGRNCLEKQIDEASYSPGSKYERVPRHPDGCDGSVGFRAENECGGVSLRSMGRREQRSGLATSLPGLPGRNHGRAERTHIGSGDVFAIAANLTTPPETVKTSRAIFGKIDPTLPEPEKLIKARCKEIFEGRAGTVYGEQQTPVVKFESTQQNRGTITQRRGLGE